MSPASVWGLVKALATVWESPKVLASEMVLELPKELESATASASESGPCRSQGRC